MTGRAAISPFDKPAAMDLAMSTTNMKPRSVQNWMACFIVAVSLIAPATASAQVVVIANGSPITELDIRQRTKLMATSSQKTPSRQDVVKELIDDRLKIAKARTYGLEVSDADVNSAFENMAKRQRISPEQFAQMLENGGISANDV
jgi:peptidyl-prolyl cis-trans isomerase SurA